MNRAGQGMAALAALIVGLSWLGCAQKPAEENTEPAASAAAVEEHHDHTGHNHAGHGDPLEPALAKDTPCPHAQAAAEAAATGQPCPCEAAKAKGKICPHAEGKDCKGDCKGDCKNCPHKRADGTECKGDCPECQAKKAAAGDKACPEGCDCPKCKAAKKAEAAPAAAEAAE